MDGAIPRLLKRPLSLLVGAPIVGAFCGLIVYWIVSGPEVYWGPLVGAIVVGAFYSTVITFLQSLSGKIGEQIIPRRRPITVPAQALLQTATLIGSFFLVTWIVEQIPFVPFSLNFGLKVIMGFVALTASLLSHGWIYSNRFYKEMRAAEQAALRAELQALRAQINPHFLFNSLNSIAALIRTSPDEAEEMVETLADLLRYSLRASSIPRVTLGEELTSIDLYLSIQRARFRDRLEVQIDAPERLRSIGVPSLILQPIVENAVKHGLGRMEEVCVVSVAVIENSSTLTIRVMDSGPGFDTTELDAILGRGVRLTNVRNRLLHEYNELASMRILQNGIELTLPSHTTVPPDGREIQQAGEW